MKDEQPGQVEVRVDTYTRVCLTVLAVLLTITVIGLWADGVPAPGDARAAEKFLDSGAQRNAMIKEQQQTNKKLDEIIALFKSGQAKVKVVEAKKATVKKPPAPKK